MQYYPVQRHQHALYLRKVQTLRQLQLCGKDSLQFQDDRMFFRVLSSIHMGQMERKISICSLK